MVGGDKLIDKGPISTADPGVVRLFSAEAVVPKADEWMLKSDLSARPDANVTLAGCVDLDMGMGSRVEGFRICGHR